MFSTIVTVTSVLIASGCAVLVWRTRHADARRSAARVAALATLIDPAWQGEPQLINQSAGTPFHPLARVALGFGAVTAAIVVLALALSVVERPSAATATAAAPTLELLALQHRHQGHTLVISGTVRNQGSRPATGLFAEISLFGGSGESLGIRRVQVQRQLAPGAWSAFALNVDDKEQVRRFRVRFRSDSGIERHVDRRVQS